MHILYMYFCSYLFCLSFYESIVQFQIFEEWQMTIVNKIQMSVSLKVTAGIGQNDGVLLETNN